MWRDQKLTLIVANLIFTVSMSWYQKRYVFFPAHLDTSYERGWAFLLVHGVISFSERYGWHFHQLFILLTYVPMGKVINPLNTFWYSTQDSKYMHSEKNLMPPLSSLWHLKRSFGLSSADKPSGEFSGELSTRAFIVNLPHVSCVFLVN